MMKLSFMFRNGSDLVVTFDGDVDLKEICNTAGWWFMSGEVEKIAVYMPDVIEVKSKKE